MLPYLKPNVQLLLTLKFERKFTKNHNKVIFNRFEANSNATKADRRGSSTRGSKKPLLFWLIPFTQTHTHAHAHTHAHTHTRMHTRTHARARTLSRQSQYRPSHRRRLGSRGKALPTLTKKEDKKVRRGFPPYSHCSSALLPPSLSF